MAKPPEVDVDTVNALLDVVNETAGKHPNLTAITAVAVLALGEINSKLTEELQKYNAEVAEEKAKEEADRLAKEKEDAERHSERVRTGASQSSGAPRV